MGTVKKHLKYCETTELLFIPGFEGPNNGGHWFNIIVQKTMEKEQIIYVADSLGMGNFLNIQEKFRNTPLKNTIANNKWIFIDGPHQHAGSNDCAVFLTHVFASYLMFKNSNTTHTSVK